MPMPIDQRIRQHRTGRLRLTVRKPDGRPLADTPVAVRQTRHRFLFGCNLFRLDTYTDAAREAAYQRRFADLLNFATLPFYWSGYEPREGETQAERQMKLAHWCAEHGITAKGHPLCYHMTVPEWARALPYAAFKARQFERITREVAGFAGWVDVWDVINETVWTPGHEGGKHPLARVGRRLGRVGLVKEVFARARAANPHATLLINDCDPIPAYARLVRDSLAAGAAIDVVGIQSHMHKGYWGPEKAWQVCEEYARFGKPLHFSELTILSGIIQPEHSWSKTRDDWHTTAEGEAQQAEQVVELYRLLFSHPAVQAITWWDLADDHAWLGAPAGLLRRDLSPKPAYDALMKLVKGAWWTGEQVLRTDAQGCLEFDGFLGDYAVTVAGAGAEVALASPGASCQTVMLAGNGSVK
jgi:endo-1,4-beta-xylanase